MKIACLLLGEGRGRETTPDTLGGGVPFSYFILLFFLEFIWLFLSFMENHYALLSTANVNTVVDDQPNHVETHLKSI